MFCVWGVWSWSIEMCPNRNGVNINITDAANDNSQTNNVGGLHMADVPSEVSVAESVNVAPCVDSEFVT